MGLVHQHRHPRLVGQRRNGCHIADHALIGGAGDDHQPCLRVGLQRSRHRLRPQTPRHAEPVIHGHRQIDRLQIPQLQGVINRFMAPPGQQHRVPRPGSGADPRKDTAGTAAHQEKGPAGAIHPRRPVHAVFQDALRVMEVIKAVDLRNIQLPGEPPAYVPSLVAGHVHGAPICGGVMFQFFQQLHEYVLLSGCRWAHR